MFISPWLLPIPSADKSQVLQAPFSRRTLMTSPVSFIVGGSSTWMTSCHCLVDFFSFLMVHSSPRVLYLFRTSPVQLIYKYFRLLCFIKFSLVLFVVWYQTSKLSVVLVTLTLAERCYKFEDIEKFTRFMKI